MCSMGRTDTVGDETELAPGPLFVVSMWRSGSSLLYALLNKHPDVALMYEADLVLLRSVFWKPSPLCDWAERWEFWNQAFTRHGMSVADAPHGIDNFPSAFAAIHKMYAQRSGGRIWGDKSPNYYDRLGQMARDFPDARFVIVWRDPHDTANSILSAASMGNSYFRRSGAALCGLLGYVVFKRECDRLMTTGRSVCQVSYEDLIEDTPAVMRHVCGFLEISYDESLSSLQGADRSAIYDAKHHANAKGDTIVRGPRPQEMGPAFRSKIDRYVVWWHHLYRGAWPPCPPPDADVLAPPNSLQRSIDRARYRAFRARDRALQLVFAYISVRRLQAHRVRRRGRETAAPS